MVKQPHQKNDDETINTKWIFKKDISVGNILTMVGLIVGMFAWGNAIERRLSVVEEKSAVHVSTDARQDSMIKESKDESRQRLDRIEDKLDAALAAIRSGNNADSIRRRSISPGLQ
jgi:hypothetical protein